jgi:colanic acid/amylovoran biosynthesis protein
MLVEIKGVHFGNQGAHLMLLAALERLVPAIPGLQVVLATGPNCSPAQVRDVAACRKLKLRKRWLDMNGLSYRWPDALDATLNRLGFAAEGQVDAILDASGFAYGGHWTEWLMAYAAAEIERGASRGRPYVFLPQAFGPFATGRASSAFAEALDRAALVCVRDEQSGQYLRELCGHVPEHCVRFPDFTIGVSGDTRAAARLGVDRSTVLLVPNRHMASASNSNAEWRAGYLQFLTELARNLLREGHKVAVLNHEGRDDAPLCDRLAAAAGGLQVIREHDPRATKGVIGSAAAVVCSRFHGCVAALSQGVPCLGTSWSHKYGALFADFGVDEWLLRDCDVPSTAARLTHLLDNRAAYAEQLLARAATLSAQTEAMWIRVLSILRGSAKGWCAS